jgi:hypothetical protein
MVKAARKSSKRKRQRPASRANARRKPKRYRLVEPLLEQFEKEP